MPQDDFEKRVTYLEYAPRQRPYDIGRRALSTSLLQRYDSFGQHHRIAHCPVDGLIDNRSQIEKGHQLPHTPDLEVHGRRICEIGGNPGMEGRFFSQFVEGDDETTGEIELGDFDGERAEGGLVEK